MVEKYGDDYALSRAGHLLCQYDDDLGDAMWQRLVAVVRGDETRHDHDDQRQFDYLAATQWSQTAAAMQAAEILDIGDGGEFSGLKILDLGCGSGVWSCAIGHRDPTSTVTAVDRALAIEAAQATADSIELSDRFATIESDPIDADVPDAEFDLVLVAQRTSCMDESATKRLVAKAAGATKPGGRVVMIDLFRAPGKTNLTEAIEALRLDLSTHGGRMRTLEEAQADLRDAGLGKIQFTFLAASEAGLGMAVGTK
jgi:ubiquinone/menaquinone biosynthesis C-methylase UbiE